MAEDTELKFDPIEMRARLAARNDHLADFLRYPLYLDEAATSMPGLYDYYAYRGLPPEEQVPPGLNSGDFADALRCIPHPGGVLAETRVETWGLQTDSVSGSRVDHP
jgi:hypothetical protein